MSALWSYSAWNNGLVAVEGAWLAPLVNSGWCQYAAVHGFVFAARSWRSHCSCALPADMLMLEFSDTMCQLPRS